MNIHEYYDHKLNEDFSKLEDIDLRLMKTLYREDSILIRGINREITRRNILGEKELHDKKRKEKEVLYVNILKLKEKINTLTKEDFLKNLDEINNLEEQVLILEEKELSNTSLIKMNSMLHEINKGD